MAKDFISDSESLQPLLDGRLALVTIFNSLCTHLLCNHYVEGVVAREFNSCEYRFIWIIRDGEDLQSLVVSFRVQRLRQLTEQILKDYGGKIPSKEAQLLELPGVGMYTARSVCANAFGQPKAVLDTNVARILERFFGFSGGRVKWRSQQLQEAAEQVAPKTKVGAWNLALLDFGAAICTARNPRCVECPLRLQCQYAALG